MPFAKMGACGYFKVNVTVTCPHLEICRKQRSCLLKTFKSLGYFVFFLFQEVFQQFTNALTLSLLDLFMVEQNWFVQPIQRMIPGIIMMLSEDLANGWPAGTVRVLGLNKMQTERADASRRLIQPYRQVDLFFCIPWIKGYAQSCSYIPIPDTARLSIDLPGPLFYVGNKSAFLLTIFVPLKSNRTVGQPAGRRQSKLTFDC